MNAPICLHVCLRGASCLSSGSQEILLELERQIAKQGLEGAIVVVEEGCLSLCSSAPNVVVTPCGARYGYVQAKDCAEIVKRHGCQS